MFTLKNDNKKIVKQAKAEGYTIYTAPSHEQFFTYFHRRKQGIVSKIKVSPHKRKPMIHIDHRFPDGTTFFLQRVMVNKAIWSETKKYIDPAAAHKTIKG